uniref:Pept_C1 domain-containing protein n=1 Tax=Panagrellus redivivus TaxID=6233 RepID=A0A7E4V4U0_PANRE
MLKLNIAYDSEDELMYRFQIFSNNLKRIERAQTANENTLFGVNHFTLMSDDERRAFVMPHTDLLSFFPESENIEEPTTPLAPRPASVDWRTKHVVTRVKDQGKCDSSWAFALTGTIESVRAIHGHPLEDRSEQELIDCLSKHGCVDKFPDLTIEYLKNEGVTLEKLYPYTGKQQTCRKIKDERVKVPNWATFVRNESKVADWVAAKGPVLTAAIVTHEMYAYKSGVFNPSKTDCEKHHVGVHAFEIVGYGTENKDDYWLLKNNWGTKFGDHGYIKMKRGVNSCGIVSGALAPILHK